MCVSSAGGQIEIAGGDERPIGLGGATAGKDVICPEGARDLAATRYGQGPSRRPPSPVSAYRSPATGEEQFYSLSENHCVLWGRLRYHWMARNHSHSIVPQKDIILFLHIFS